MGFVGPAQKFGVKLHADVEGMHIPGSSTASTNRPSGDVPQKHSPCSAKMPGTRYSPHNGGGAVPPPRRRHTMCAIKCPCNFTRISPQPQCPALLRDANLIRHGINHRVTCGGAKLAGVSASQACHMAGKFNDRHLQSQADPQEGKPILPGVLAGEDLALNAAFAKTAGTMSPSALPNSSSTLSAVTFSLSIQ